VRETDALIARLRDRNQRFLAVVGASGSGKSSLVRAGLLPRLQQGAIEGSQYWCVLTLTPGAAGGNPFLALAFELAHELPPSTRKPAIKIAEEQQFSFWRGGGFPWGGICDSSLVWRR
jgi:energy-coupling factor transporter ATP-binding protein EcfA2